MKQKMPALLVGLMLIFIVGCAGPGVKTFHNQKAGALDKIAVVVPWNYMFVTAIIDSEGEIIHQQRSPNAFARIIDGPKAGTTLTTDYLPPLTEIRLEPGTYTIDILFQKGGGALGGQQSVRMFPLPIAVEAGMVYSIEYEELSKTSGGLIGFGGGTWRPNLKTVGTYLEVSKNKPAIYQVLVRSPEWKELTRE